MALSDRRASDDVSSPAPDGAMGFLDHLDELRGRLIRSCIAVMLGMGIAYFFAHQIAESVLAPTSRVMPAGTQLQLTKQGGGFAFYLDITLIAGALLASPYLLFQVW